MTRHIGEVPVEQLARERGQSTYTVSRLVKLWVSHLTSLTVLPLQFAMVGSFSVSVLGFVVGTVQLVRVLIERKAPAGWLSLFVSVTFLFSVLFAFLGIISAYLGRMYVSLNERDSRVDPHRPPVRPRRRGRCGVPAEDDRVRPGVARRVRRREPPWSPSPKSTASASAS